MLTRRFWGLLLAAPLLLTVFMGAESCDSNERYQRQITTAQEVRTSNMDRAMTKYPLPAQQNFPLRRDLTEMTKREDLANHPWYVYVLGDNGNIIGYYVTKSVPQNACNFLSTEGASRGSLDGVYYGQSQCDVWLMFDAATDAEIKIRDIKWFVSDRPLRLQAQPITVEVTQ